MKAPGGRETDNAVFYTQASEALLNVEAEHGPKVRHR